VLEHEECPSWAVRQKNASLFQSRTPSVPPTMLDSSFRTLSTIDVLQQKRLSILVQVERAGAVHDFHGRGRGCDVDRWSVRIRTRYGIPLLT